MSVIISAKKIQVGQKRAYEDSVYIQEISVVDGATDAEIWEECQEFRRANNRDDNQSHSGHCGFPFGLDSYGSLKQIAKNEYRYSVTEPFCD